MLYATELTGRSRTADTVFGYETVGNVFPSHLATLYFSVLFGVFL